MPMTPYQFGIKLAADLAPQRRQPIAPVLPDNQIGITGIPSGNPGAAAWLDRNYSSLRGRGPARQAAHTNIWNTVRSVPGAAKRYPIETRKLFDAAQQTLPESMPLYEHPHLPIVHSLTTFAPPGASRAFIPTEHRGLGAIYGADFARPGVHVGAADQGGTRPSFLTSAYRNFGVLKKVPPFSPTMDRNIIGVHEMEHGKQIPTAPIMQTMEPPAVMAEMVSAAEAARRAAGKAVRGRFALTPKYKPKLEWLRQQAQQHGYELLGGDNTMTELLNTPAGQAWLRMQYNELNPNTPKP